MDIFFLGGPLFTASYRWDCCNSPYQHAQDLDQQAGRSREGQGRLRVSCLQQKGPRGAERGGEEAQGTAPTRLLSRLGSSWGRIHRLVPRRAELLLSSKNTTPLPNKHRGSCEIMQHERPSKGLPEILIGKRWRLHLPLPGAAKAISEVLLELKAKVRLWRGPVPGAEGTGWEETLKKGSKQTLAGCLGGGAFHELASEESCKGAFSCPLSAR